MDNVRRFYIFINWLGVKGLNFPLPREIFATLSGSSISKIRICLRYHTRDVMYISLLIFVVRPSQQNVSFPIALRLERLGRSVGRSKKKQLKFKKNSLK